MNKILVFRLSYLRNDAHSQFMFIYSNLLKAFPAVMAVVAALYPEFEAIFAIEEQLVDASQGSEITGQLAKVDKDLDRLIVGINSIIQSGMHHFDTKVVEAANRIRIRMRAFGNIGSKAYKEEANAVRILVNDLRNNYSEDMATLALTQWVDALALAGTAFDTLFVERNTEWSDRPKGKMTDVRRRVDAVYRPMTARINAAALMDDVGAFDEFINQLNREIKYFVDHSHRHARKDIAPVDAADIANQEYTGKNITPIPQLTYNEEGKEPVELVFSVDFTLTYRKNIAPGTATIIVHGKSKYRGRKIITFNIDPPEGWEMEDSED